MTYLEITVGTTEQRIRKPTIERGEPYRWCITVEVPTLGPRSRALWVRSFVEDNPAPADGCGLLVNHGTGKLIRG